MSKKNKAAHQSHSPKERYADALAALRSLGAQKSSSVEVTTVFPEKSEGESGSMAIDPKLLTSAGSPIDLPMSAQAVENRLRGDISGLEGKLQSEIAETKTSVIKWVAGIAVAAVLAIIAIIVAASTSIKTDYRERVRDLRAEMQRSQDKSDGQVKDHEARLRDLEAKRQKP